MLGGLIGCNPEDDNTPPPNPTSLPTWSSIADLTGPAFGSVSCMEIYNGDLYVGGDFYTVDGVVAKNIVKWDGTNWSPVPGSKADLGYAVKSMKIYNGSLYVLFVNYNNLFQKWDGTNWSTITPSNTNYSIGSAMISFNGLLYLGANQVFDGISLSNIVPSDANPWQFSDTVCSDASSYCIYNNELYCSGEFTMSNNGFGIFKLINNEWKDVAGVTVSGPIANNMIVYNNQMYAIGNFQGLSGLASNNFASWNGNLWTSYLGIDQPYLGETTTQNPRIIINNGSLYVSCRSNSGFGELCLGETYFNPDTCFSNIISFDGTNWDYIAENDSAQVAAPIIMYNSYLYAYAFFNGPPGHESRIVRVQPQ